MVVKKMSTLPNFIWLYFRIKQNLIHYSISNMNKGPSFMKISEITFGKVVIFVIAIIDPIIIC